jgi:protein-tyrosine phosphatase
MKYVIVFGLFGLVLGYAALSEGGSMLLLLWPAASLLILAAAYAGLGPGVYGKRADGRLAPVAMVLVLPYLLVTWLVWHLYRLIDRERCCHEVAPGLWLGRRAFVRELPPGIALVVDLTAEFAAPHGIRHGREYVCVPTLDDTAPDESALRLTIERILAHKGPVYVHCAQGRGRSALVAAGVLVRRGLAVDARKAEEMLRDIRSCVRLTPGQRKMLAQITPNSTVSVASKLET